jgi:hypothetical protein
VDNNKGKMLAVEELLNISNHYDILNDVEEQQSESGNVSAENNMNQSNGPRNSEVCHVIVGEKQLEVQKKKEGQPIFVSPEQSDRLTMENRQELVTVKSRVISTQAQEEKRRFQSQ